MVGRGAGVSLVADVDVRLDAFHEDMHLEVADGEVVGVLGPNGAGKTTLLRALAGMRPLSGGRIVLDGQVLDDPGRGVLVPPEQRSCGLVFQEHLLFPHLDALANVAFGPRRRGASKSEATTVARDWLDRLGVADLAHQRPGSLSGGQSQRVALARALAIGPRLLLLDEPMAALDVTQRTVVRQVLRDQVAASGTPCVLVTHDPLDATALADTLVLVEGGQVVQRGTSADVARRPVSPWVARMMGVNLLTGHVRAGRLDLGAALTVPVTGLSDGERWAVLAPRDVVVTPYGSTTPARVAGDAREGTEWSTRVVSVQPTGDRVVLGLEYPAGLTADVAPRPGDGGRWSEGMAVQVWIDPSRVEPFAPPASRARVD
jgi:molybdate transport system ATP-binding protein